jgi:predicted XRE-type DNA-binding protein
MLGDKIKHLHEKLQLQQRVAASALGFDTPMYSSIELVNKICHNLSKRI